MTVGIYGAVVPVDSIQNSADDLDRRKLFSPVAAEQLGRRQESDLSEAHTQQPSDESSVLERRLGFFQVRIVHVLHHPAIDVFDQIFRNFTLLGDRRQPNTRRGHVDTRLRDVD
jgi:hypothetical protein